MEVLNLALTNRERQILELLARGRTEKGAARELGISNRAVGNRTRDIRQKMGVDSTKAAIVIAQRYNLIEIEG